ncbi:MAG: putative toxin-antitoxin system toxin component, PIN family [Bacteroidetes bacterium]|nr:putative toxin-antitoxin system toxin component, PIN family [Bacteroidota bacterium]
MKEVVLVEFNTEQKVIIDTNFIVSALIQRSYPNLILNYFLFEDKFELCISDELMAEYYEVLTRPKFSKFPDFFNRAENVLTDIASKAKFFTPLIKLNLIKDEKDNMILELADECEADYIITGNSQDFTFSIYKKTKIVTPKEYWDNHQP